MWLKYAASVLLFRKEVSMNTQLESVKEQARVLLYTDIHLTEFSPVIVQHPFTIFGYVGIKEDGEVRLLEVSGNEDDLRTWRNYVCGLIEKAETAYELYMLFTDPYALTFLKFAKPYLSRQDLSHILASAWTSSENPNRDPNVKRWELLAMFRESDPKVLMTLEDYAVFRSLPDTVTVYRGVTSKAADSYRGLSWSLEYNTARWFAQRFGHHGCVYEGQIAKEHIHAYFSGRNESEVIIHPKYLRGLIRHEIKV